MELVLKSSSKSSLISSEEAHKKFIMLKSAPLNQLQRSEFHFRIFWAKIKQAPRLSARMGRSTVKLLKAFIYRLLVSVLTFIIAFASLVLIYKFRF